MAGIIKSVFKSNEILNCLTNIMILILTYFISLHQLFQKSQVI